MENINIGDFVICEPRKVIESLKVIITSLEKNNSIKGIVIDPDFALGCPIFTNIKKITKITDKEKIKELQFQYKLFLLQKS